MSNRKSDGKAIHPGEVLQAEFLDAYGMSTARLARAIGISPCRIRGIVKGSRRITGEIAVLLGRAFKTTPEFWMNLQGHYDLQHALAAISADQVHGADGLAKRLRKN